MHELNLSDSQMQQLVGQWSTWCESFRTTHGKLCAALDTVDERTPPKLACLLPHITQLLNSHEGAFA